LGETRYALLREVFENAAVGHAEITPCLRCVRSGNSGRHDYYIGLNLANIGNDFDTHSLVVKRVD
jgi:hypothetical protein